MENKEFLENIKHETVEEMFDNMDREWREEHPVYFWIDNTLFKDKSIYHYAPHYVITHPWILVRDAWYQLHWAWQRVFRGWDDRVVWSIDYHLAEMLPIWLRELKKYNHGIPSILFTKEDNYVNDDGTWCTKPEAMERANKEYDEILEKIAKGFELYAQEEDLIYTNLEKKAQFDEAFDLFKKYWGTFWD